MKLGIMQPYLFPYIGYFQLIQAVDTFIIYDDVTFISQGWINRNRLKINGDARYFTVPLSGASSFQLILETQIATAQYRHFYKKFFATLKSNYGKSPFYQGCLALAEATFCDGDGDIGSMARRSIQAVCDYLGIATRVIPSSSNYNNANLERVNRIIDLCRAESASTYINAAGGQELYAKERFAQAGVDLQFLKSGGLEYGQVGAGPFIQNLSILDVLMNNSPEQVRVFLNRFELV